MCLIDVYSNDDKDTGLGGVGPNSTTGGSGLLLFKIVGAYEPNVVYI